MSKYFETAATNIRRIGTLEEAKRLMEIAVERIVFLKFQEQRAASKLPLPAPKPVKKKIAKNDKRLSPKFLAHLRRLAKARKAAAKAAKTKKVKPKKAKAAPAAVVTPPADGAMIL